MSENGKQTCRYLDPHQVRRVQLRGAEGAMNMMSGSENLDTDLTAILSKNPWVEMIAKIKSALDSGKLTQGRFVLEQDNALICIAETLIEDDDYKLRLNLPPQPFIGHPSAKIWILQYNPGYSEGIDDLDYLGTSTSWLVSHMRHNVSQLQDRIRLICDQYEFKDGTGFYVLDRRFNTFRYGTQSGRGAYLWYKSTYFPKEGLFSGIGDSDEAQKRFADKNLFVMEYFPYHSKKFRHEFFPFLPSFLFWRQLMQYAFTHEKIVLCNGLNDLQALKAGILQSVPGYQEAVAQGWLHKIGRIGQGRSRLMLKRDLVLPLKSGTTQLEDFLRSAITDG